MLKPRQVKEQNYRAKLWGWFAKGRRAGATLLALLALIAASLSNWTTLKQWGVSYFGDDDSTLVVRRARLIPYFAGFPDFVGRDQFSLQLELRNYGTSPVILTSAGISIADARGAKIGPGGSAPGDGGCTLSSSPNDHQPIELPAGGEVWLEISPMVNLPGIHKWLDSSELSVPQVASGDLLTIRNLKLVDDLNDELALRFGPNAKIIVALFTGVQKKRRTLTFFLARGKDLFARDGSLLHDALISYWLAPNAKASSLGCRKISKELSSYRPNANPNYSGSIAAKPSPLVID